MLYTHSIGIHYTEIISYAYFLIEKNNNNKLKSIISLIKKLYMRNELKLLIIIIGIADITCICIPRDPYQDSGG